MMGITPEQAVKTLHGLGAAAVGGNCGNGPDELLAVIQKMRAVAPDVLLVSKSNAGIPELIKGRTVYRADPPTMGRYAEAVHAAGARIIGGCCGNTPEHMQAMSAALHVLEREG
jgi:methionine synthase I (cobalamin-dependent)